MANPLIGTVVAFTSNFAPQGWAFCDGSLLPITQYPTLFMVLGTTYGGDGQTSFGLPDLRGREAVHAGDSGPFVLGQQGGHEAVTLTERQLPPHNHNVGLGVIGFAVGRVYDPTNNALSLSTDNGDYVPVSAADGEYGGVQQATVGNGQPIAFRSPYLALNYIIALEGDMPSR
jgi:microcystin-dependent protein